MSCRSKSLAAMGWIPQQNGHFSIRYQISGKPSFKRPSDSKRQIAITTVLPR